tara:strand:- start:47889 stop:48974 length:1086 start_codon:yes stop_codon:yes gene_type:complete
MKSNINLLFKAFIILFFSCTNSHSQDVLKVAVVGLSHDHAHGIMHEFKNKKVIILGIVETDIALVKRYQNSYAIPSSLFYNDLEEMLKEIKPDAVLAFNPISEHVDVARICLPLKIPVMVEKPLATTLKDAQEMAKLSRDNHTLLLTNYETTWYGSNQTLKNEVSKSDFGTIKKMIAKDGHNGPKEIGCSKEFLNWLTDPEKNGGGAIVDFGCYGANLMTWLQDGEKPIAVTAITRNFKPNVYPKVDDDATIILEYKKATGIIEASWDWSYSIKDFQVYGENKSYYAANGNTLVENKNTVDVKNIKVTNRYYNNYIVYLKDIIDGKIAGKNDLSSLENNLIVVEILEAAKKSARTGKRIKL